MEGAGGGVAADWRASWPMRALYSGKKRGWGESGARRLCDNKSLRLHLNARDFSQHKSKMSAGRVGGCVAAARMGFRGKILKYFFFLQKKNSPCIPPSGSRPTTDYKNLSHNKVSPTEKEEKKIRSVVYIKMYINVKIYIYVLANYLHSIWWLIECN